MSLSSPFIHRPTATVLLTVAIALAGAVAFRLLPVSPLPQVDFPGLFSRNTVGTATRSHCRCDGNDIGELFRFNQHHFAVRSEP